MGVDWAAHHDAKTENGCIDFTLAGSL